MEDVYTGFWKHILPSDNPGWSLLYISKGDVRYTIDRSFSKHTQRFLHIEKTHDGIYTVIWMRNEELEKWRHSRGCGVLRNCIGAVLSEKDGRRFFPEIYRVADELKEQRKIAARIKKLLHQREQKNKRTSTPIPIASETPPKQGRGFF